MITLGNLLADSFLISNDTIMRLSLFLLSFLFSGSLSFAQVSLESIMSTPFPTTLTSSEKTNKVAWVFNEKGVRNIWIYNAQQGSPQQITSYLEDDGQDISQLIFRTVSSEIIYLRGGAPNRKGEIPNPTSQPDGARRVLLRISEEGGMPDTIGPGSSPQLAPDEQHLVYLNKGQVWIYNFSTGKSSQLFKIRGNPGNIRWSPDSKKIAFVSNRGTHSFIGIYEMESHQIHYLAPSVDRDNNPVWSPDGNALAFTRIPAEKGILPFMPRRRALPWSVMVHNFAEGKTTERWKATKGQGSAFRFISAKDQLMWTAENFLVFPYEGDGWTHLWGLSLVDGKAKNLTPGNFEVQFAALDATKENIFFSANKADIDRQHIWKLNPATGILSNSTGMEGIQWSPVESADNQLYCLGSGGTSPAAVYKVTQGKLVPLVASNFPEEALSEPEQIIFSSADGMEIHGQLFKPKNMESGKKYPAVLFFHGGSRRQMLLGFHHRGYYHNAYALNQYLATRGYIVLSVNYRSGIGYGMKFREALNYGARGASEFLDVMGAGLYMRSRPDVDPKKIGLWGGSYGGYLTALGLAKASDLFAAGVDIHGVHDWNVVIKNFVPGYQPEKAAEAARLAFESSPMPYVKDWRSPVLLIHGDDDRNVPFSETVDIMEALRKQEVYFEQLIFPDEVHGFLLHNNWLAAFNATADFFDRMLK